MKRILIALCLAALVAGCATSSEEEPAPEPTPVAQPAPPPPPPAAPAPEPMPVAQPMLPETAGTLPLVGLAGAGALALAGALRGLRRFLG
jgi:hypothetical protein